MNIASTMLLAFAMSTDAFAAAVSKGTALKRPTWMEALRTGSIFGAIEAVTPLVGWALGFAAAEHVKEWDHWIAVTLLSALGVKMLASALRKSPDEEADKPVRHGFWLLALTGFATSIDAMAVGAGLAFIDVNILPIALSIGMATFLMVTCGVMVGKVLGKVAGRWAEGVGGALLIGIGFAILFEHLGA